MTIQIDDQFVDIDFDKQPEFTAGDLGDTPFDRVFGQNYEDVLGVMNERELREAAERQAEYGGLEELITRIFDQMREGSCVLNASGAGCQAVQAKTYGKDNVIDLSAISAYKQAARSAQSGTTISKGFEVVKNIGFLPLDTPKNREAFGNAVMPNTGWNERYPADWKNTAKHFQLLEANVIRTMPGLLTSLAREQPVIVGRDGHSICYLTLIWDGRKWKVLYVNSWGQWGFAAGDFAYGFGADSASKIQASSRWAYSIRAVRARQGGLAA